MSHELVRTLEALRRRMLRQRWVCALAAIAAAFVGGAIVLASIDWTLRISDPGLRWMLFACWLAIVLWTGYRFGIARLRSRLTALDVARLVESEYPQFGDRLASAWEFVHQAENDPLAGSAEMRRAVVVDTAAGVERLPRDAWRRVIDSAPLRRSMGAAGAVGGLALLAFVLSPSVAQLATARLLQPWRDLPWPRIHHLEVVEAPSRIAKGQNFEATISDSNAALPEDGQVYYRIEDAGQWREESFPLTTVGDVLLARRENVQRSFAFRVTGGDDDSMAWRDVTVVDPPRLESFAVMAVPPAYSGLPQVKLDRHIRVLTGTELTASGESNEPLQEAAVEILDGPVISAAVDGKHIAAAKWQAEPASEEDALTTSYRVRMENRDGIVGSSDAATYRVDSDSPPELSWGEPSSDQFVLADAVVPVRVAASDNLAIRSAALLYRLSSDAEEEPQRVEIYAGSETPPEQSAYTPDEICDRREFEYAWDLAPLMLEPGTELSVLVEAADYQPATGTTALPRRIRILTLDEFDSLIADQQARIVRELEQALVQQRSTQQRTRQLELEMATKPAPSRGDVDQLTTAGLDQRQIGRRLVDPAEGVQRELESLRKDLANNRVERAELTQQLERVEAELARLGESALPQAESELTSARKSAEAQVRSADSAAKDALAKSLAEAGQAQSEIVSTLEELVGGLQQWSDFQRFAREVARLQQEQGELRKATQSAAAQAAAASQTRAEQLRAEQQRLIEQQSELARRLDKLQQEMADATQAEAEQAASATESIADALNQARELGTAGKLRDATRQLQSQRLGRAASVQQQAEQDLQALLDTLRGRTTRDPEALAEELRESQERLAELREELAELERQAQQQTPAKTGPQQESLAEKVARAARQMLRMGAQAAGQSTQQAAGSLEQSAQEGQTAEQQEQSQQQGRERADEQLAQAEAQLQEQIRRLEQQLAERKLDELARQVADYVERQRAVLTETLRLDDAPQPGDTSPLATSQRELEAAVRDSAQQFKEQPVFKLALTATSADMHQATKRLDAGETGRSTQQAEHAALIRLGHIANVLRQVQKDPEEEPNGGNQGGQGGQGGQPPPSPIDIAELKMLRLMQAELNQRTRRHEQELAQRDEQAPADPQSADLAADQERLANLVDEMIRRLSQPQSGQN